MRCMGTTKRSAEQRKLFLYLCLNRLQRGQHLSACNGRQAEGREGDYAAAAAAAAEELEIALRLFTPR
jgi:hypothetical protein